MSMREGRARSSRPWALADVPDLGGSCVLVTGATGGLGFPLAGELARAGAHTIVTVRDRNRATSLHQRLQAEFPQGRFDVVPLDLADLSSVARFAAEVEMRHPRIDVLINNAGIMLAPRALTVDGFELHMGTNHLGHFALTAHLMPLLAPDARVVTVSSLAAKSARRFDMSTLTPDGSFGPYNRWRAYAQSKLANLLFATEFARRLAATGSGIVSVAAHPGFAATELTRTGMAMSHPAIGWAFTRAIRPALQPADQGMLPMLRAAVDPAMAGGDYAGPARLGGARGAPVKTAKPALAGDETLAAALWGASERAIGRRFVLQSGRTRE